MALRTQTPEAPTFLVMHRQSRKITTMATCSVASPDRYTRRGTLIKYTDAPHNTRPNMSDAHNRTCRLVCRISSRPHAHLCTQSMTMSLCTACTNNQDRIQIEPHTTLSSNTPTSLPHVSLCVHCFILFGMSFVPYILPRHIALIKFMECCCPLHSIHHSTPAILHEAVRQNVFQHQTIHLPSPLS